MSNLFPIFFPFSGKSRKGCVSYNAIKGSCGKEVLLMIWSFDVNKINAKCPISCDQLYKHCSHKHGDLTTLVKAFKERANYLIQNIDHSNLVRYIDVNCTESNDVLTIHLVQDYIKNAKSVRNLAEDGILPNVAPIAEWMLKVISYLEKMKPKIHHGYINDGSIFIDSSGMYRVADFNLIPYLMYLKGTKLLFETNDLKALGSFINRRNRTIRRFSKDFIEKCCSDENEWSCQDLLSHTFLSNVHIGEATTTYNGPLLNQFEFVEVLGRGSDGCVIKVRLPVNDEYFALKIIKIPIASKGMYTKVQCEVQIIPKVNHKRVVKYIANWEQTIDVNELGISFNDEKESECSSSDSVSGSASIE